jgi:uncharacterized protein (DUF305 family)
MTNELRDVTNSIGKAYMALFMAASMVTVDVVMHDIRYNSRSTKMYIGLFIGMATLVYLYRTQAYVTDKNWVNGMLEHHSMALQTSKQILKKTSDYNVAKLAKQIVQQQTDEIREMRVILTKDNIV